MEKRNELEYCTNCGEKITSFYETFEGAKGSRGYEVHNNGAVEMTSFEIDTENEIHTYCSECDHELTVEQSDYFMKNLSIN